MSKVFILALDGVPFSLLSHLAESGVMPHTRALIQKGAFRAMNSVQPPISSSAWASFLTGGQPAEHGILGFTERNPCTMEWFTPDARQLKMPTLLQLLSKKGKRVFSMNVPMTSPPTAINGVSIGGFLARDLQSATYPSELAGFLIRNDYRIDTDVSLAKSDFRAFIADLEQTLERRIAMIRHFYQQENWDYFMAHIMETDRLHHFTFEWWEEDRPEIRAYYEKFYTRIDKLIGETVQKISKDSSLTLLSDHGFTTLKQEVYLNRWLWENAYLRFTHPHPENLHHIHPQSRVYSLYPGRIFINLQGREKNGSVTPGIAYEQLRRELRERLLGIRSPLDGEPIFTDVFNGEDIYARQKKIEPEQNRTYADLLLIPKKGYELKGGLWNKRLFDKSIYNGMHTFDNAFVLCQPEMELSDVTDISRVFNLVMKNFDRY